MSLPPSDAASLLEDNDVPRIAFRSGRFRSGGSLATVTDEESNFLGGHDDFVVAAAGNDGVVDGSGIGRDHVDENLEDRTRYGREPGHGRGGDYDDARSVGTMYSGIDNEWLQHLTDTAGDALCSDGDDEGLDHGDGGGGELDSRRRLRRRGRRRGVRDEDDNDEEEDEEYTDDDDDKEEEGRLRQRARRRQSGSAAVATLPEDYHGIVGGADGGFEDLSISGVPRKENASTGAAARKEANDGRSHRRVPSGSCMDADHDLINELGSDSRKLSRHASMDEELERRISKSIGPSQKKKMAWWSNIGPFSFRGGGGGAGISSRRVGRAACGTDVGIGPQLDAADPTAMGGCDDTDLWQGAPGHSKRTGQGGGRFCLNKGEGYESGYDADAERGGNDIAALAESRQLENSVSVLVRSKFRGAGFGGTGSGAIGAVAAVILSLIATLIAVPVFFRPPTVGQSTPPAWYHLVTLSIPLTVGISEVIVLLAATYICVNRGSAMWMYFLRHAGFYLSLSGLAYLVTDGTYLYRYGRGGLDRTERIVRMAISSLLLFGALTSLLALESGACAGIRRLVGGGRSQDYVHSKVSDETRRRRLYRRLIGLSVMGYQIVALLFTARTIADYLIRDMDNVILQREHLVFKYVEGRYIADPIQPGVDVPMDVMDEEFELGGSALILSLYESMSSFGHNAFFLSLFSLADVFPHNPNVVAPAAFASFVRFVTAAGYVANASWHGIDNIDGIWSLSLSVIDLVCALVVLYATLRLTTAWRRLIADGNADEYVSTRPGDDGGYSVASILQCHTLRAISSPRPRLYSPHKRRRAMALSLSSFLALAVGTVQCLLLLTYNASVYESHYVVDAVKYGSHLCALYVFINYVSVTEEEHYRTARYLMAGMGMAGAALGGWQLSSLMHGCAIQGMTTLDAVVLGLFAAGVAAHLGILSSSLALKDVYVDLAFPASSNASTADEKLLVESLMKEMKFAKKNQKRLRFILCLFYIPVVVAYVLCVAVYDGHEEMEAINPAAAAYPLVNLNMGAELHALHSMAAGGGGEAASASQRIRRGLVVPAAAFPWNRILAAGSGASSTSSSYHSSMMPHISPTIFLFVMNQPGMCMYFHFGLILTIFAADGLRTSPAMTFSLATARLLSTHACVVLVTFLASAADYALALSPETGEPGWMEYSFGEKAKLSLLAAWFVALVPLAAALHVLWGRRKRIARAAYTQKFGTPVM